MKVKPATSRCGTHPPPEPPPAQGSRVLEPSCGRAVQGWAPGAAGTGSSRRAGRDTQPGGRVPENRRVAAGTLTQFLDLEGPFTSCSGCSQAERGCALAGSCLHLCVFPLVT